jgi:hypothetical protein
MGKCSVTIRGALITGACAIVAAIIMVVPQCLSHRSPVVKESLPIASVNSAQDSNDNTVTDSEQSAAPKVRSFDDFLSRLAALEDRNLEREEFLDSMVGQKVVWRGWVRKVWDISGDQTGLILSASRENPRCFGVTFPASTWRTKLYALRNGDQVEVTGIYRRSSDSGILDGLSIALVEPK